MFSKFRQKSHRNNHARNRRMAVEPLENRALLTTFVVDALGDADDGNLTEGNVTLREAISVANFLPGEDTIVFDTDGAFATPTRIDLSGELTITDSITVEGPGADRLTIDGKHASRIFNVTAEGGNFDIQGLRLVNGSTTEKGGAIRVSSGELRVVESTISGSSAAVWGGGIYATSEANLTIVSSTVTGNSGSWGGGVLGYGNMTIDNSTISGNSADRGGGGIYGADVIVNNSTITNNTATFGGGIDTTFSGSITLANSIVAGNTGIDSQPDVRFRHAELPISVNFSLIGDAYGVSIGGIGNIVGDSLGVGAIDPQLAPLANNGGPMKTHALLTGSPALNAGDPNFVAGGSHFDQRGRAFHRVQEGIVDMGAYEDLPEVLTVDTAADTLDGDVSMGQFSLREAVMLANVDPGPNTISFDTGANGPFASPAQIDLTGGELEITESITFDGPGADRLTIDANDTSRIFNMTADGEFTVRGLTLTGGNITGRGGAIQVASGELLVEESAIRENTASSYGGGIYAPATANLLIVSSTVSGNTGSWGGGLLGYGSISVDNSTISGNEVSAGGGGIYGVDVFLRNSTITNNTGGAGGGIDLKSGGSLTIENSILAGNIGTFDSTPDLRLLGQNTLTVRYSMIGDAQGISISGSGNIVGDSLGNGAIDPQLAPLADNGGPTMTHAPLPTSFVIDEGDRFAVAGENGVPNDDQRGTGFTRVYGGRTDMGAVEVQPDAIVDGDFNDDGAYDCTDIDSLVSQIATGENIASFDLDGDGNVDLSDRDEWLVEAGNENLPTGNAYRLADANLDGVVDVSDFNVWNANKFTSTAAWCSGDFNADGVVDVSDFNVWNDNKFTISDQAAVSRDSDPEASVVEAVEEADLASAAPNSNDFVPRTFDAELARRASYRSSQSGDEDRSVRDAVQLLDDLFANWI